MGLEEFSALIQTGGLLGFAYLVWTELKTQRAERAALDAKYHELLSTIKSSLATIQAELAPTPLVEPVHEVVHSPTNPIRGPRP